MPVAATQVVHAAPAGLRLRKNVSLLTADELRRLRGAMRRLMDRQDNEGYGFYAGWHGIPLSICRHHEPLFLPWHRGYLLHFELALQRFDPTVTLPWWDWLNEPRIPASYAARTVGGERNVLASAAIRPIGVPRQPGWPRRTHRRSPRGGGPLPVPPPLNDFEPEPGKSSEQWVMAATSFDEMRRRLEALHDNMHVWVGGEMSDPTWAAYDPLFWAHHTMVDRLWRIWQHRHPNAPPTGISLDAGMTFGAPPAFTPRQVLDVKSLGYDYAATSSAAGGTI
jgi:tyrosinase